MTLGATFISPHLDDAAFSCGTLIAAYALVGDVTVVTVCTTGDDERSDEDLQACKVLGARCVHLGLSEGASVPDVEKALDRGLIREGRVVFAPVGLRHPDHVTVAAASRARADWLYEELPYRVLWPEYLPHPAAAPALELPTCAAKQAAIACYRSQLGDGAAGEALWAGERYHRA